MKKGLSKGLWWAIGIAVFLVLFSVFIWYATKDSSMPNNSFLKLIINTGKSIGKTIDSGFVKLFGITLSAGFKKLIGLQNGWEAFDNFWPQFLIGLVAGFIMYFGRIFQRRATDNMRSVMKFLSYPAIIAGISILIIIGVLYVSGNKAFGIPNNLFIKSVIDNLWGVLVICLAIVAVWLLTSLSKKAQVPEPEDENSSWLYFLAGNWIRIVLFAVIYGLVMQVAIINRIIGIITFQNWIIIPSPIPFWLFKPLMVAIVFGYLPEILSALNQAKMHKKEEKTVQRAKAGITAIKSMGKA